MILSGYRMIAVVVPAAGVLFAMPMDGGPSHTNISTASATIRAAIGGVDLNMKMREAPRQLSLDFQPDGDASMNVGFEVADISFVPGAFDFAVDTQSSSLESNDAFLPVVAFSDEDRIELVISIDASHLNIEEYQPAHESCGWSDGTDCTFVPIPWLRWAADERTQFYITISHQQLGESVDVGVMGMLSMEF